LRIGAGRGKVLTGLDSGVMIFEAMSNIATR
jgi:hypothetical protein